MNRELIYDVAGIMYRTAKVMQIKHRNEHMDGHDLVGITAHTSLMAINKWYNQYKPTKVIFAFEGGNNWRKKYTASDECVRKAPYKGNRVKDPELEHLYTLMNDLRELVRNHTSIYCLCEDGMEADDMIGGYCQLYADDKREINVVSGDKDFIHLLQYPNVSLIDPDTGKLRNQPGDKGYQEDLDYWMFLKCIRGDSSDNVLSAYPRVFETKLKKAYQDEFEMLNLMNHTWIESTPKHGDRTLRVGDLYEENRILMDLTRQPPEIRAKLEAAVRAQANVRGTYNHIAFLQFLGKFSLKKIGEKINSFVDMFSANQVSEKKAAAGEPLLAAPAPKKNLMTF